MTLSGYFMTKCVFWPELLESERLNVRNSTTSTILRCSVHFTIYMYLSYTYTATAEKQRVSCACMRSWRAVSLR